MIWPPNEALLNAQREIASAQAREIDRLIQQAVSKATGQECLNVYDFINRLGKMEHPNGDCLVYLDGRPILWISGQTEDTWRQDELTTTWSYRFLS